MPYKTKEEKREYDRKRYQEKRAEICAQRKKYREENPELIKERKKKYREENKEKIAAKKRADYLANPEKFKERSRKWRQDNKARYNKYQRDRFATNANAKLAHEIRCRVATYVKRHETCDDVGCDIRQLREYLQDLFTEGMTWQNYGEWHVDHIKPLASFDLTDEEQFKAACHYTNLQPMWAEANFSKGRKLC